jgi:hypothetical protein
MASDPPVDFIQRQASRDGNYPFSISASDLMQNFAYATMDVPDTTPSGFENLISVTQEYKGGGKIGRSIFFKPTPDKVNFGIFVSQNGKMYWSSAPTDNKTYIPAVKGNQLQWIETEEC